MFWYFRHWRFLLGLALAGALGSGARAQEPTPTLTLDDAIQLALTNNRALRVTSYERGISRANLLVARGAFDPAINISRATSTNLDEASYVPPTFESDRVDSYGLNLSGLSPVGTLYSIGASAVNERFAFDNFSNNYQTLGGFQITQPLLKGFGFGANLAQVRIAKANRSISDQDYRQMAITTVTSVVIAYSNLQLAHDDLDVAERTRGLARALLEENEKSHKIGSISESDVVQARAQVAALEEPVLIYERQVRDAENALRELIGNDVFFEDQPLFILAPVATPAVAVDRHADLDRALLNRPDYQIARLTITKDRAGEAQAVNGVLPQVNFIGGYFFNGISSDFSASRQMVWDRMNPTYSAGIAVTLPITNAVGRGNLRVARLTRRQAEEQLLSLKADIARLVATAEGQIETTRQRVVADQRAYALAQQAVEDEEKKKKAGASTTLAVQQVQQNLANVGLNVSTAIAAERQAVAVYDQTLGTTLDRYHIKLTND